MSDRWPPWAVTSSMRNLDDLTTTVTDAVEAKMDPEVLSWLSRLLVVRTSGCLEQSVHEITRGLVAGKSGGIIRTFAHSWLERSRNPSPEALLATLGRFDTSFEDEFADFIDRDDQRLRRDIAFLVSRRNAIAHGFNEGVRLEHALSLVPATKEIVDWFVLRLNPL